MKIIKNAIIYKAKLPSAEALRGHLEEHSFKPIGEVEPVCHGFDLIPETGELVSEFDGGLAFAIRTDAKILPASAVKAETKARCERIEEQQGYKPGRKQTREIKEQVYLELLPKALVRSSSITCYYDRQRNLLYVPTTAQGTADIVMSLLIRAVESVETTTIHVDAIAMGITTRLKDWLNDDEGAFGPFDPTGRVVLKRESDTVTVNRQSLEQSSEGIEEALADGFVATEIRFTHTGLCFNLTDQFRLKAIKYEDVEDMQFDGDQAEEWAHDANVQNYHLGIVIDRLVELLSYKEAASDSEEDHGL